MLMTMTNCKVRMQLKKVLGLESKEGDILVRCTSGNLLLQVKMKLAIKQSSSLRETILISFQISQILKMLTKLVEE